MQYSVEIAEGGNYILCRAVGAITNENSHNFAIAEDRLSRETGVKRILVDLSEARNTMSVADKSAYAHKEMPAMNLQRDVRVAVLVAADDYSHDFIAVVAQNSGYNVHLFRNEAEAIAWLIE